MLKRKPLGRTKKLYRWRTWDGKIGGIVQDLEKLNAARQMGFIYKTKAIFFIRVTREIEEYISMSVPRDESPHPLGRLKTKPSSGHLSF